MLLLHYSALALATWTGNFDAEPNRDHARVMRHVLDSGLPQVAVWPPGFGYFLALKWTLTEQLGLPYWTSKLFLDPLLMVASGVLATLLGAALTRNRWLAVAAGGGQLGAPIFLLSSAEGLSVLLFQPIFLLALWLLVRELQAAAGPRPAGLAAAGAATGLACLVRANPQFLVVALAPLLWWLLRRGSARRPGALTALLVAAYVAGQTLVLAPWLFWQRHLGLEGVWAAPVFYYAFIDGLERHPGNRVSDWVVEHHHELERSFETVVEINRKWIREDPGALVRLYAIKAVRTWYLSDSGRWDLAILLTHAPFWIGALLGTGLWLRRARDDPALLLVLVVVLYMWGVSALVSGLARYMGPVYGLLGLLCGVPVAVWWRRRSALSIEDSDG